MTEQDKPALATFLVKLHTIYGGTPSAAEASAWYDALAHHELRAIQDAVDRWIAGMERISVRETPTGAEETILVGRFFPKPAELVALMWARRPDPPPAQLALPEVKHPEMHARARKILSEIWSGRHSRAEILAAMLELEAAYPGVGWQEQAAAFQAHVEQHPEEHPQPAPEEKPDGLPFAL